jgi:hypothetical protein
VCRVERIWADGRTEQRLSFHVKLAQPVSELGDAQPESDAVVTRFLAQYADLAAARGVGILADRAVPALEKNGIKVYTRQGA